MLLAARLRQKSDAPSAIPALPRENGQGTFPLSSAQQRMWFLEQWDASHCAYIQLLQFRLTGQIRPDLLQRSLDEIIRRHETLRTTFILVDGELQQQIHTEMQVPLAITDLRSHPMETREEEALRQMRQESRTPFDLMTGPLLRAQLLHLSDDDHRLTVTMHHIVTDAWSLGIFMREMAHLYTVFARDSAPSLPALPIQYADFAAWQREWMQSEALTKQINYWTERLGSHQETLNLPTDRPRPALQAYDGAKQWSTLPPSLAQSLKEFQQQEGATLFMMTLAAFYVLLYRYTGQEELYVGSPIANRNLIETENVLGFFTNTLVLRGSLSGTHSFRDVVRHVREITLESQSHQEVPFERLVEALQPERDLSRSPLFQVLFQHIAVPTEPIQLPGAAMEYREFDNGTSKFDLTLQVAEMVGGMACTCEYNTDLFDPATITRMLGHYQTLLEGMVANPDQQISLLPLLTVDEKTQQDLWNRTETAYTPSDNLALSVESWAERTPDAVAVKYEGTFLTYREWNQRANQLAHFLQKQGVGREVCVGVVVERSVEMMVALLAILKAGGAYVPIDPLYPSERIASILEDIQTPVLLTQERLLSLLPDKTGTIICLDRDWSQIAECATQNPTSTATEDNLAYVIFTSGSTGRPKGVQITHRSIVHLMETTRPLFKFGPQDVCTVFHSYAFDFSVWEIWCPLTAGGCLVIVPVAATKAPEALHALLKREKVTVLNLTPSALRALMEQIASESEGSQNGTGSSMPKSLRLLACGGEALPGDLVPDLMRLEIPVWNFYGPTESTVWAAIHQVQNADSSDANVCIGRPLPNTQLHVLDAHLQPLPVGIPGELHIGAIGLARGYRNRPELTEERFIPSPFEENSGARLYKTGDLAVRRTDGSLRFLGRLDHQVKLRGFRIELGEIEAALNRHESVNTCVVVAYSAGTEAPRLVAYVVAEGEASLDVAELRTFLASILPDYMLPASFVFLPELPLNSNGKVNRRALPAPTFARAEAETGFVEPSETLHLQLQQIWQKVLGIHPIGLRDNFFDLGGHSLIAIRLMAQIEKLFGKKLPLNVLFQAPTIEQMANIVRDEGWSLPYKSLVAIQPNGSRPPLFCVHGAGGQVLFYHDLVRYLPEDQPLYGLESHHWDEDYPRLNSVEEIAEHYLNEIRTLQAKGPYYLCGTSLGGIIAYEMAQQLHADGQEVAFLGLFDGFHPQYMRFRPGVTAVHRKIFSAWRTAEHHVESVRLLPRGRRWPYVREKSRRAALETWWFFEDHGRKVARKVYTLTGKKVPQGYERPPHPLRTACEKYVAKPYPGCITLFRADRQPLGIYPDPTLGWGGLPQEGIETHEVPGFHAAIVVEPRTSFLAAKLRPCLETAQQVATVNVPS